jgi:hypothetical protein
MATANQLTDSNALTMAAVTVMLKDLLSNGLVEHGVLATLGDVPVTALPPDRVPIGDEERPQLNLYLYRVTPRAARLTPIHTNGTGPGQHPLPTLDLHYLLVAYGAQDLQAEILLGSAIELLRDHPVVSHEVLRAALAAGTSAALSSPTRAALARAAPGFAAVDRIEISPEYLSTEETTKLWSALQAHFRASVAYRVVVVPTGEIE